MKLVAALHRASVVVGEARRSLLSVFPELLTGLAFVGGWTLITAGVVVLTSPLAWFFSGGLLAISLGGWRLFYIFIRDGLYVLTQQGQRGK